MAEMTYAEAHAKLKKELAAAGTDKMPYVILPLDVARAFDRLAEQMHREEISKTPA